MLGGQSKTWILSNALVTITTSGGSQLAEDDAKSGYHGGPMSCTHCGWAEVLIRRPTGNISWLMRLQNQVGGAVVGVHALNSTHTDENIDPTLSLLTTPVVSRTSSHSNGTEPTAPTTDADATVDVFNDSTESCDDQQFPIEVDDYNLNTPTATDESHPPQFATAATAAFVHSGQLQRSRHESSCSLELLPPLMSYDELQTKSPSLHGGGSHLTDEEQV